MVNFENKLLIYVYENQFPRVNKIEGKVENDLADFFFFVVVFVIIRRKFV